MAEATNYDNSSIVRDKNSDPIPQGFDRDSSKYFPLQGKSSIGAVFSLNKDMSGNTQTYSTEGYTLTELQTSTKIVGQFKITDGTKTANISTAGYLEVLSGGSPTLGQGSKDVTTSGSAEQLSTGQVCHEVIITAKTGNTNKVYLGSSLVSNSSFGAFLRADDSITLSISDLNQVYLDVDTDGEGVRYLYV